MELPIRPLKWKRAKHYSVAEIPDPSAPETLVSRTVIGSIDPERYYVPTGAEEAYEAAVSPERKICLALANTVSLERITAERMAEWDVRACQFAKAWGLLESPSGMQRVAGFLGAARNLRWAIETVRKDGGTGLRADLRLSRLGSSRKMRADMVLEASGEPSLHASSLLAMCWIELIEAVQQDDKFYDCENPKCDRIGIQPKWGRPHKYCSDACRKKVERAAARARGAC